MLKSIYPMNQKNQLILLTIGFVVLFGILALADIPKNNNTDGPFSVEWTSRQPEVVGVASEMITSNEIKKLSELLHIARENESRLDDDEFRRIAELFLKALPGEEVIGEGNCWDVRYTAIPGSVEPAVRASLILCSERNSYLSSRIATVSFDYSPERAKFRTGFEDFGYQAVVTERTYRLYMGDMVIQVVARDQSFEDPEKMRTIFENMPLRMLEML